MTIVIYRCGSTSGSIYSIHFTTRQSPGRSPGRSTRAEDRTFQGSAPEDSPWPKPPARRAGVRGTAVARRTTRSRDLGAKPNRTDRTASRVTSRLFSTRLWRRGVNRSASLMAIPDRSCLGMFGLTFNTQEREGHGVTEKFEEKEKARQKGVSSVDVCSEDPKAPTSSRNGALSHP